MGRGDSCVSVLLFRRVEFPVRVRVRVRVRVGVRVRVRVRVSRQFYVLLVLIRPDVRLLQTTF